MIGTLVASPRHGDADLDQADQRVLHDLARQIAVVVHTERLTTDLQRSRQQLVTAREEERRRIHRDLHDELGPTLAAVALQIEHACRSGSQHRCCKLEALEILPSKIRAAVGDIRSLVEDLRPATLDELGLSGAIREQARRFSATDLAVCVEAPRQLGPMPAAVEVAAYRIVSEALTNTVRHAEADDCLVRVVQDEQALQIVVSDDGRGFGEQVQPGVGLRSIRERAAEVGGWCTVHEGISGGVVLTAFLPLETA